jgi:hypothetical protein
MWSAANHILWHWLVPIFLCREKSRSALREGFQSGSQNKEDLYDQREHCYTDKRIMLWRWE